MDVVVMTTSVLVPTYRRPDSLRECVRSVMGGSVRPAEIVIVGRRGDVPTDNVISWLEAQYDSEVVITRGWVDSPGHMPPVQLGAEIAAGEVPVVVDGDVTV